MSHELTGVESPKNRTLTTRPKGWVKDKPKEVVATPFDVKSPVEQPTQDPDLIEAKATPVSGLSFDSFGLPTSLLKGLKAINFHQPSPIQAQAIPLALKGRDVLGLAQTGTGKTAAFALPMIAHLFEAHQDTALILAPTRELGLQIKEFLSKLLGKDSHLRPSLLIGGLSMRQQNKEIANRPRILVATPGRLVDHLQHKPKLLEHARFLVLDEADRMLDMGFLPQLNVIRKFLPQKRQTLMFSATMPKETRQLINQYLRNPAEVRVGPVSTPVKKITQKVIETTAKEKNNVLMDELNARKGNVLVFVRTKHRTERLNHFLQSYGYKVARIHGNRTQAQRQQAIDGFSKGQIRILVATDIVSRGLDIKNIEHVINYDLPQVPEDYVHRIGRTGRNGASGEALCLLSPEERNLWKAISRHLAEKR